MSLPEEVAAISAGREIKRCAPFKDVLAKEPALSGLDIRLTFHAETQVIIAERVTSRMTKADGSHSSPSVTEAIGLVLEIERNEAAAMQKRSTPHLYRLTATRTALQDGIVFLEQDVGANNVVYATVYCAFNETDVDASRIPVGGPRTYSAVLFDVSVTQQYATSGFASGVINFKQILLTSCQITD